MGKLEGYLFTAVPAIFIIGVGIFVSSKTGQWHWFARSGSVLIAQAILMFSTRATYDYRAAQRAQVILALIGTLIWGFGDLLG
jgi:hypothetical protein